MQAWLKDPPLACLLNKTYVPQDTCSSAINHLLDSCAYLTHDAWGIHGFTATGLKRPVVASRENPASKGHDYGVKRFHMPHRLPSSKLLRPLPPLLSFERDVYSTPYGGICRHGRLIFAFHRSTRGTVEELLHDSGSTRSTFYAWISASVASDFRSHRTGCP